MSSPTNADLEHRFRHHPPQGDQVERYNKVREGCLDLAKIIRDCTPCSREQSRALNALDETMMLANAAIARNE